MHSQLLAGEDFLRMLRGGVTLKEGSLSYGRENEMRVGEGVKYSGSALPNALPLSSSTELSSTSE